MLLIRVTSNTCRRYSSNLPVLILPPVSMGYGKRWAKNRTFNLRSPADAVIMLWFGLGLEGDADEVENGLLSKIRRQRLFVFSVRLGDHDDIRFADHVV